MKNWIDDNLKGKWEFGGCFGSLAEMSTTYKILFEDEEDAMAFKLRWL
ncbi:MAG: hypothetical protein IIC67_06735 [Thaumarchaeota archaeon]|nr:hypothetical protein [Nitrososphaerota archaeon]